jgi:hypothetical protein
MTQPTVSRAGWLGVSVVLAAVTIGCSAGRSNDADREAALRQFGIVLKVYSSESRGTLYPPRAPDAATFVPDPKALAGYLAQTAEGTRLSAYLAGKGPRPICYLGHVLSDEDMGLRLLDEYAKREPEQVRYKDVPLEPGAASMAIYRFREGIERFFIPDVMSPVASFQTQSVLPLAWELPEQSGDHAALVLYFDGHVEWRRYPGEFPFTRAFVERLCGAMGRPAPKGAPLFQTNSPVGEAVNAALEVVTQLPLLPLRLGYWSVQQCDTRPSVSMEGQKAYRVVFRITQRRPQSPGEYQPLPDSDLNVIPEKMRAGIKARLPKMDTAEDFAEFVLFPIEAGAVSAGISKLDIPWTTQMSSAQMPAQVDLGTALGYHWFAQVPFYVQGLLHKKLGFVGGEDQYQLYVSQFHLDRLDVWRSPAFQRLQHETLAGLNKIEAQPSDFEEYVAAYELRRSLEEHPVAAVILHTRSVLHKMLSFERYYCANPEEITAAAEQAILGEPDHEAASIVMLEFVLPMRQTSYLDKGACRFARDLLKKLPRETITSLIGRLATSLQDSAQAEACSALLKEL